MSNYGRLSEGLKIYRDTMRGFVAKRLRVAYPQGSWFDNHVLTVVPPQQADNLQRDVLRAQEAGIIAKGAGGPENVLDINHFRFIIAGNWDSAFLTTFKNKKVLTWIREVGDERNTWAHAPLGDLDPADVNRVLDSCARVLEYVDVSAAKDVKELRDGKKDVADGAPPEDLVVLPPVVEKPAAERRAAAPAPAKAAMTGLRPWRDVIAPHPDVQAGRYVKAEFAAHLGEVKKGKASAEYGDPKEFFRRTYVTDGMRQLLVGVVQRLRGVGGDPVIDLKTAFGGGKTHTMLAAYHLVNSAAKLKDNADVQRIFEEAGGPPPKANVAVLVGTDLDPISMSSRTQEETGGFEINTLWGEIAYQLAGLKGYKIVQDHDAKGIAPGADVLEALFAVSGPTVILIDELVAFLRSLPSTTRKDIPAGTFGTHMTFCQALTEAASKTPNVVVLASIPQTKIEYGDARGEEMAAQISNIFRRIGAPWQPVGAREAFEVVRRRLFGEIKDEAARDRTCEEFYSFYRQGTDFPAECREPAYMERMQASYPIHPEIFERLYLDWAGNIDRFQRTRGVLRLMADVIHRLWETKDADPLIMPGSLPLYDSNVRQQLIGYLDDNWAGPFDADIDGEACEAALLERGNQRFGQVQACRRLTRTVFLGSVPGKSHLGLEVARVMLGASQPGEGVAIYGDALRALAGRLSYLYGTDNRYWFEVRPNLNKVAADRIARVTDEQAHDELRERLRKLGQDRGDFAAVHAAPRAPSDVSDEPAARLVILGPEATYKKDAVPIAAVKSAAELLESRGTTPRIYKNMVVFLAADTDGLASTVEEAKRFIGWESIAADGKTGAISLDKGQQAQAEKQRDEATRTVENRLLDAYKWLIVPEQQGTDPIQWTASSVAGGLGSIGSLALRASNKLVTDGLLITQWSPLLLRRELDQWIWADGKPHVGVKQVWGYLATYLYFSRLRDVNVFLDVVKNGVRTRDYFGYADGVDGDRYLGLVFGEPARGVVLDDMSVLVRPEAAAAQVAIEPPEVVPAPVIPPGDTPPGGPPPPPAQVQQRRFYASTKLNSARLGSSAGQIGDEIVQHLNALIGADVTVTIEIQATVPDGIPENVVRTVSENAKTLKFEHWGFEEE